MKILEIMKGALAMPKVFEPRSKVGITVLEKRKLDFNYQRFMKSTQCSPLISTNIGKKSGGKESERNTREH